MVVLLANRVVPRLESRFRSHVTSRSAGEPRSGWDYAHQATVLVEYEVTARHNSNGKPSFGD